MTFVEFANPERGLAATFLPAGFTIPGAGYTAGNPPVSQYNTALVFTQYDGWSDPPNRPWNLLADFNALHGRDLLAYGYRVRLAVAGGAVVLCDQLAGRNHDHLHDPHDYASHC